MLDTMRDAGIENVLALRGDPPAGETEWTATEGGLRYSRELIELIRDDYDFAIGAACFPEVHIHATDAESDLRYLKEKVDAGARFLITQLFFDNHALLRLRRPGARRSASTSRSSRASCRSRTSRRSSASRRCAARRSPSVPRELELRADEPGAVADLGVAYATLQCADLLANGAPGHPLLHAQPLAGDARDPQRAAADGALARRRAGVARARSRCRALRHARRAVGRPTRRRPGRPAVGRRAPGAEEPAPEAESASLR